MTGPGRAPASLCPSLPCARTRRSRGTAGTSPGWQCSRRLPEVPDLSRPAAAWRGLGASFCSLSCGDHGSDRNHRCPWRGHACPSLGFWTLWQLCVRRHHWLFGNPVCLFAGENLFPWWGLGVSLCHEATCKAFRPHHTALLAGHAGHACWRRVPVDRQGLGGQSVGPPCGCPSYSPRPWTSPPVGTWGLLSSTFWPLPCPACTARTTVDSKNPNTTEPGCEPQLRRRVGPGACLPGIQGGCRAGPDSCPAEGTEVSVSVPRPIAGDSQPRGRSDVRASGCGSLLGLTFSVAKSWGRGGRLAPAQGSSCGRCKTPSHELEAGWLGGPESRWLSPWPWQVTAWLEASVSPSVVGGTGLDALQ